MGHAVPNSARNPNANNADRAGPFRAPHLTRLKNEKQKASPTDPKPLSKKAAGDSPKSPPPARKWLFRLTAVIIVPVLFLLLLEVALRIAHYGYPTDFLVKRTISGKKVLVENEQFGFLFFPPGIARSPTPIVIPAEKAPGTYRIFLFGESAALGDPKPAYGFGRYLEVLLNNRFPGTHFEVICAAMTAINSHALLPVARECARYDGDLWLVYMGNNELIGPFGASGVLGERTPSTRFVRTLLAIKSTKIGQLLYNIENWVLRRRAGQEWSGLKMFVGHQVPPNDPARGKVNANFAQNLRDMVQAGQNSGAKVLLTTVPSNLEDCAPHASMHGKPLSDADAKIWLDAYNLGIANSLTNAPAALQAFDQALKIDPLFANTEFLKGRSLELQTRTNEALKSYRLSRDYDALPFRTTTDLNEVTRAEAARNPKGAFLDLESAVEPEGKIPGSDLFFDHVHLNFAGNYRVAVLSADEIARQLPATFKEKAATEWLSETDCERQLGLTDWNRILAYDSMLGRLSDAPYTNQITNPDVRRDYAKLIREMRDQVRTNGPAPAASIYTNAISQAPNDFYLHQNYAEFLETSGNPAAALAQWQVIEGLIPQHPIAFYQSGRLLNRMALYKDAETHLESALQIRYDFAEASVELAKALGKQNKHTDALARCDRGLKYNPENAALHFQKADSLAALNRKNEALAELKTAVRLRPRFWEARYFLGVELASREQVLEAEQQFVQVVRLRPDFALGHLNLGVALARQHRFADAAVQFEETLKLDPKNSAALKNLEAAQQFLKKNTK